MGRKRYRGRNILRKVNPNTGFLETIDKDTGETLEVDKSYDAEPPPSKGQFDINAFLQTHVDAAEQDLWGDELQDYLTSNDDDWYNKPVEPPKTTIAQSAPKDTETYNFANSAAIIKKLNEKYPTNTGGVLGQLEQNFKYNPYTDSFDPYLTFEGKEYTVSEIQELNTSIAEGMPKGISSGGGGLLGSLNDLANNIKGSLPNLTNINLTDLDLTDLDLTDLDLSGGHSVNTEQDLADTDLSGGVTVDTTQDLAGATTTLLTEGLESVQDFGITAVEQLGEGAESANEFIDATITGIGEQGAEFGESAGEAVTFLEEQAAEGAESLTEAGTFLEEQIAEGAESALEFVNATVTGAADVVHATGTFIHDFVNNPYEQVVEGLSNLNDWASTQLFGSTMPEFGTELIVNMGENLNLTPPSTPGPGTGPGTGLTTAQPMVGGDMSNAALQEQVLPRSNIRQDMMNPILGGRRKTMLTIGQSASKINARRIG